MQGKYKVITLCGSTRFKYTLIDDLSVVSLKMSLNVPYGVL